MAAISSKNQQIIEFQKIILLAMHKLLLIFLRLTISYYTVNT